MYREFLCQYNVVFIVGKIELLNPEKTEIDRINPYFIHWPWKWNEILFNFCLFWQNCNYCLIFRKNKRNKKIKHKSKKNYEQILYEEGVGIISSDKCGLEKNQLK